MGSHSGSRKWFGLWTHTGRHSDTPVLEPDSGHTPEPEQHHGRHAARRRSEDATAAHTLPLDPVDTVTPDGRHRRSRVTSAGLCAAVALVTTGAAALVQTQTDTQMPTRQSPITAGPRSSDPPSPGVPLDVPERPVQTMDPLPATQRPASPKSPSAARSEPRSGTVPTVAPSTELITPSPRPRVTVTHTVPASSPEPQPTVTVTETRTRFLPLPRVTVTVTVPVPLPEPSG